MISPSSNFWYTLGARRAHTTHTSHATTYGLHSYWCHRSRTRLEHAFVAWAHTRASLLCTRARLGGARAAHPPHACTHKLCSSHLRLATRLARASLAIRRARLLASPRLLATHLLASPARRLLASPTRLSFASILARRLPARMAAMKWKEVIRVGKGEGARGCSREIRERG